MDALAAGSDWLRRHGERAAVVLLATRTGSPPACWSRRACGPVVHVRSPWEDPLPGGLPLVVAANDGWRRRGPAPLGP